MLARCVCMLHLTSQKACKKMHIAPQCPAVQSDWLCRRQAEGLTSVVSTWPSSGRVPSGFTTSRSS